VARAQHTVNEIRQRKPSQSDSRADKKTGPAKRQTCCPSRAGKKTDRAGKKADLLPLAAYRLWRGGDRWTGDRGR
jgi:hypothetical protein